MCTHIHVYTVCIYIYIYIYICVNICVCVYAYLCIHMYMHSGPGRQPRSAVSQHLSIHPIELSSCRQVYMPLLIHMFICMYIYIYIYTHIQGTHTFSAVCDSCAPFCVDYVRIMCADYVRTFVLIMCGIVCGAFVCVCVKVLLRACPTHLSLSYFPLLVICHYNGFSFITDCPLQGISFTMDFLAYGIFLYSGCHLSFTPVYPSFILSLAKLYVKPTVKYYVRDYVREKHAK